MQRRVFYSFHYSQDSWRAGQVRNIGVMEGNQPASDNDWEIVKQGGDRAVKKWIDEQMRGRSCTVVLVGSDTAWRKWIIYESHRSWNIGMGVVGVRVHGLKDENGRESIGGEDPFNAIQCGHTELSSIVKCYNPEGEDSRERYNWIKMYLAAVVEEAIEIRKYNAELMCIDNPYPLSIRRVR